MLYILSKIYLFHWHHFLKDERQYYHQVTITLKSQSEAFDDKLALI